METTQRVTASAVAVGAPTCPTSAPGATGILGSGPVYGVFSPFMTAGHTRTARTNVTTLTGPLREPPV